MRATYVFLICIVSLILNVLSVYNIMLGFASLLLIVITVNTNVFVKAVNKAKELEKNKSTFPTRMLASYGSQKLTRIINKFAVIFGLIVVSIFAVSTFFLQSKSRDTFSAFIGTEPLMNIAQFLSNVGWVIFILSFIIVTIHTILLMRTESIFVKKS